LFDMALYNTTYPATWFLNAGVVQQRLARSAHPSLTPCQLYETADGWIYIMANKEKFWPALCDQINKPEWADDPRFRSFKKRLENRSLVEEFLDAELSQATTAEWLERFAGTVPASPINDIQQALDNPFVTESDRIQTLELEGHGPFALLNSPIKPAGATTPAAPAPKLGAHTDELLRKLGYDDDRLASLKSGNII